MTYGTRDSIQAEAASVDISTLEQILEISDGFPNEPDGIRGDFPAAITNGEPCLAIEIDGTPDAFAFFAAAGGVVGREVALAWANVAQVEHLGLYQYLVLPGVKLEV